MSVTGVGRCVFSGCCHTAVGTAGPGPCPLGISAFQCVFGFYLVLWFLIDIYVFLENTAYMVIQSILLKKMFSWKKKTFRSLKFSEVFARAALHAGRCSGLCVTTFGQLYLELSPSLSMTVVLTEAK